MEYSLVSHEEYKKCFEEANDLVSDISDSYSIDNSDVKYQQVINYLNKKVPPIATVGFTTSFGSASNNESDLNKFNSLLNCYLGLDICCSNIRYEKLSFVRTVSGLTLFNGKSPILLLNASTDQSWHHIIFTIIHEFVHIYEANKNVNYFKAAALIGNHTVYQTAYPSQLQPLENRTNDLTSLLYAPSYALQDNILNQSFSELSDTYSMSWPAMHNRLFNFFYYEYGWDYYSAKNAVFAFRNSDLNQINEIREKLTNEIPKLIPLPF